MADPAALTDVLAGTLGRSDPATSWLAPLLLNVLAAGEPVTVEQVADASGHPAADVRSALAVLPDTEYDDDGRIVGSGITLRETPHQFTVDGRLLFTWCALDTLIFPVVLGRSAQVTSPCHATGVPVRVTVEPDRVVDVRPPDAVVSVVTPREGASIRGSFCNRVHYFASEQAAQGWLAEHAEAQVMPVRDAFVLGRLLADQVSSGRADCC